MSFPDYIYGPHSRWVPSQAPSYVQHSRAGGAGPSSSSSPRASHRASPRGALEVQEIPDRDGTPGPFTNTVEEIQEGSALQEGPYIGPGESSSSKPEPTPSPAAEETSSPQLSPASRIRRPLFVGHPIPGNVRLHSRDFHGESYYDVPALTVDPRFRDSMRLIEHYSLLPFMTPR